jgi:hypothetical protein
MIHGAPQTLIQMMIDRNYRDEFYCRKCGYKSVCIVASV